MEFKFEGRIGEFHAVQVAFNFAELHVAGRQDSMTDPPRDRVDDPDENEEDDGNNEDYHVSPVLPFLKLARNTWAETVTVEVPEIPNRRSLPLRVTVKAFPAATRTPVVAERVDPPPTVSSFSSPPT